MPTRERFSVTAEIVSAITSSLVIEEVLASVARRTAEVRPEVRLNQVRLNENAPFHWPLQ